MAGAPLEVAHDFCSARTAEVHEEVVAIIHDVDYELLHLLLVDSARCVHVF